MTEVRHSSAAQAPSTGPDLQQVSGYEELRRRYLRAALAAAIVINLLGLLDTAAPPSVQALRLSLLAFGAGGVWRLRRGGDLRRFALLVSIVLTAGTLAVSVVRLPEGWPVSLNLVPLLVVLAALVAGAATAVGVAAASVAVVGGALLLPGVPAPPFLPSQLFNWSLVVVLLGLALRKLTAVMAQGTAELAASAEALGAAGHATVELSRLLSDRVGVALERLALVLRTQPAGLWPAAQHLALVLEESRRTVPGEPALGEVSLGARLESLRLQVMDWILATNVLFYTLAPIRTAVYGPRENLPYLLAFAGIFYGFAALRLLRPGWRPALNLVVYLVTYALAGPVAWAWFARAPISPPVYPIGLTGTLWASFTVGPWLAFLLLAEILGISLVALAVHPGIAWTAPVNLVLAYGVLAWVLWRWPRELLELLSARRDAAAEKIRERRRLVATLFHDLANPLQVVLSTAEEMARGERGPEALEEARSMVDRMRQTLAAAMARRVSLQVVEAGGLCDELELLFRERLRRKRLALRVAGPRAVRLLADVALLRDSVLANLVSNALKFSAEGGVIELTVQAGPGEVALVLEDRGPGLPDDVRAAMARGGNAPSRPGTAGEGGSGYGLMLATEYLTSMGGRLELAPREGGGLTARAVLPAA